MKIVKDKNQYIIDNGNYGSLFATYQELLELSKEIERIKKTEDLIKK